MKRYFVFLASVFLVLGFGCASGKKAVAKEATPTAKNTTIAKTTAKTKETTKPVAQASGTGQESAVTKSTAQDKEIDELMKKYSTTSGEAPKTAAKRAAVNFKLQDVNYDMYSLSDYKDKQPVLLFFWTTWCPYCQSELLMLHGRYPKLVQDGLEVFAINVGESMDTVTAYTRNFGLGYKVLLDQDTSVANSYKAVGVPTFVLVNQEGNVVFQDNIFPDQYQALLAAK